MTYLIFLSPQAVRDLENLDNVLRKQLIAAIEKSLWSLRSGKYRIIYEIDDTKEEVRIHAIGHRKKIYRKL
jgi:mRNA-degrading endonuclease RelE of RelBE toxin-antitoxin system